MHADAVAAALAQALRHGARRGRPGRRGGVRAGGVRQRAAGLDPGRRPGAWLTTAARNKALDRLRREVTLRRKLPLLVEPATVDPHDPADLDWPDAAVPNDRLRLGFTSCHPTL